MIEALELEAVRGNLRRAPASVASPLATLDDAALAERIRLIANLKRFFERYCADPQFRDLLARDIPSTLKQYGLAVAADDAAAFLNFNRGQGGQSAPEWPHNFRLFYDFMLECQGGLEMNLLAAASGNTKFRAWREKEIARLRFDFSTVGDLIVRPAVALELTKGCSVGCWFCAVSAERFGGNFAYTDGGEELWRNVLLELSDTLGPAAASAFCYWATDPLDNPYYESFASTFHAVLGVFPPTTTALPLKNPRRTRLLLNLSRSKQCKLNRFSVLSLKMLDRIHREFSAEELAFVEMVLQNPEALVFSNFPRVEAAIKVKSGRVLEGDGQLEREHGVESTAGTIACLIGFLINMVDRRVELVSPCVAGPEWPLGYRVLAAAHFADAADFRSAIERMIETHMSLALPAGRAVRFTSGLHYQPLADGFRLSSPRYATEFRQGWSAPFRFDYRALGALVRAGHRSPLEISLQMQNRGASENDVEVALDNLRSQGVLLEGPETCEPPPFTIAAADRAIDCGSS